MYFMLRASQNMLISSTKEHKVLSVTAQAKPQAHHHWLLWQLLHTSVFMKLITCSPTELHTLSQDNWLPQSQTSNRQANTNHHHGPALNDSR